MIIKEGSTDVTTYFHLRLAADGSDAVGLTITDLDLTYVRTREEPASKVDATALADQDSAHADNQAIEVDATNMPGVYRVDWPDAAFASGAREVILTVLCDLVATEDIRVQLQSIAADMVAINGSTTAAANLRRTAESVYYGTVTSTGTTNTLIDTGLTQAATDHWKGRVVIFLTGTLALQASDVTGFTPGSDTLTMSTLTSAPQIGDTYVVV